MIRATGISKLYGVRPALRSIDFNADRGEFVALLGPNGAGKSTLLRVLGTLVKPDSGSVLINGYDAARNSVQARRMVGYVSHQPLLYPDLTGYENLIFTARMYGIAQEVNSENRGLREFVSDSLRSVGLLARGHDQVKTYSRGMVQRLAIARATLHSPAVLLLDEPFTGLDQQAARDLSALLTNLVSGGRVVVMATHELTRGLESVSRAVIMKGGRITESLEGNFYSQLSEALQA